jgi:hypothetical protein
MIPYLENMGSLFEDYRIVAYENNSEDDTPSQLYRWKSTNPKVSISIEFLSIVEHEKTIINTIEGQFSKPEQRALARTKALMMALSNAYKEFSYVICIDLNVIPPSLEAVNETFQKCGSWDAVFAYRIDSNGNFRDQNAFRDPLLPLGPELLGDEWHEITKNFTLDEQNEWHPVYSAFGGCAIYKKAAIRNCKYEAIVTPCLGSVYRQWFFTGLDTNNQACKKYLQNLKEITNLVFIDSPHPNLPSLEQKSSGIIINEELFSLVWRTHSSAYQYPSVCEHVSFHASMHRHGYKNLFINPRLICVERDSHCASHPNPD